MERVSRFLLRLAKYCLTDVEPIFYSLRMAKLNLALKVALLETGKKQKTLAPRMKLSAPRLSMIVRGHDRPSAAERARIAEYLGKPESALFPDQVSA